MKKKRTLGLLLVLAMLAGLFAAVSITAWAETSVCQIGSTSYASITAALASDYEGESEANPTVITMINDSEENVVIPADRYITLDLNGYVLSAPAAGGSVITNKGTLTIKDSNTDNQTHYFKVGSDGLWMPDSSASTGTPFEDLTERPKTGDVIAVSGGCITGGTGSDGGGVYNEGTFTMNGGSIVGNYAEDYGGGVYNDDGTFTMSSGAIVGNYAYYYGGGVENDSTFTMNGGSIVGNYADDGGGGVDNYEGTFTMNGGSIAGNYADDDGGGVNNDYGTFTMNGGSIAGNYADYYGGGVDNYDGTFTMYDGSISGNYAYYDGGGVNNDYGTFTMNGGSISGNYAYGDGGGVDNYKGMFTMNGGSIDDNSALESGGGVYNYAGYGGSATMKMTGGSITGNTAGYGGGVGNYYGTFTMENASITGNKASCYGGGINSGGTLTLKGGTKITDNTVTSSSGIWKSDFGGAGIDHWYGSLTVSVEVIIKDNLTNGEIDNLFMEFKSSGANIPITIDSSDLEVNYVSGHLELVKKPACFIDKDGDSEYDEGEIKYLSVQDAVTSVTGTAETTIVMIHDSEENVTIASGQKIILDLNGYVLKGTGSSSVISNKGTLTIKDSNTGNQTHYFKVGSDGLWMPDSSASTGTPFEDLTERPETGDVIAVSGGCITGGTGTEYKRYNKRYTYGGGVYNEGVCNLNGGSIVGNYASGNGGGVINYKGTFTMNGGSISGNNAFKGGGVYNHTEDGSATMEMTGGSISGNTARKSGGGVYNDCGSFTMTNAKITENKASYYGSGICSNGTLNLNDGTEITGNTVTQADSSETWKSNYGGAGIDFFGGSLTVSGKVTIKDNLTNGKKDNLFMEFDDDEDDDDYADNTPIIIGEDGLAEGSEIGITHYMELSAQAPIVIATKATVDDEPYFIGDDGVHWFKYDGNENLVPADRTDISRTAEIADISKQTYTGSAIEPELEITYDGQTLTEGKDYTVAYSDNVRIGTATVTVTFIGQYKGTASRTFKICSPGVVLTTPTRDSKTDTADKAEEPAETEEPAAEEAKPTEEAGFEEEKSEESAAEEPKPEEAKPAEETKPADEGKAEAQTDGPTAPLNENPIVLGTTQSLSIDGSEPQVPAAYNCDGYNYFKLRDICDLLTKAGYPVNVTYDEQTQIVTIIVGEPYEAVGGEQTPVGAVKQVVVSSQSFVLNGEPVSLLAYNIDGYNYVNLRQFCAALGISVSYDEAARTMYIVTK